jgi:hypothetical protein
MDGGAVHTIGEDAMATREQLNLVQVRIHWSYGGFDAECTQWWMQNPPGGPFVSTGFVLGAFGTQVATHLDADWRPNRPPGSVLDEVITTQYTIQSAPIQGITTPNLAGTSDTDLALPVQCAVVMSYRTTFVGRSFRGRNYLPFIASDPQTIDTTGAEIRLQAAEALALSNQYPVTFPLTDGGGGDHNMQLCVYSPTKGLATPVTSVIVDTKIDTQRRRAQAG